MVRWVIVLVSYSFSGYEYVKYLLQQPLEGGDQRAAVEHPRVVRPTRLEPKRQGGTHFETKLKYERKDEEWFRFYAHLYVKYVHCYLMLEDCYDQMMHPQKRMLLKDMLESTMLRVVELKLNLIRYNTHTNAVRS